MEQTRAGVPGQPPIQRTEMWIIWDSYVHHGEKRARETCGPHLGLEARVSWFGWGGLRWKTLIPFFLQYLRGRTAPDVLLIHCGGSALGRLEGVEVVAAMKQDLQYLNRQFPAMQIVYSNINERRRWRADHLGKLNPTRKWVNSVMNKFVSVQLGRNSVEHPGIRFNCCGLYLKDTVHFTYRGN
ncbi:unnamed protein product [Arctogadus glacialis]